MSVYVPPEYEKKSAAKAFADKIIDMIEDFVETRPDTSVMTTSVWVPILMVLEARYPMA